MQRTFVQDNVTAPVDGIEAASDRTDWKNEMFVYVYWVRRALQIGGKIGECEESRDRRLRREYMCTERPVSKTCLNVSKCVHLQPGSGQPIWHEESGRVKVWNYTPWKAERKVGRKPLTGKPKFPLSTARCTGIHLSTLNVTEITMLCIRDWFVCTGRGSRCLEYRNGVGRACYAAFHHDGLAREVEMPTILSLALLRQWVQRKKFAYQYTHP